MRRQKEHGTGLRDEWLMYAENCLIVAEQGLHDAEAWMWYWLLRVAGAPA